MKILNKTYNINSSVNKKIVLISDLHYKDKFDIERLNVILDNIKKLNPDFICMPGDIIDKSRIDDEDTFIIWIKELSKINKTIISIGNHEFYVNKAKGSYKLNKEFYNKLNNINNLYVLDNKNIIIDNINFIGITLPIKYYSKDNEKNFPDILDELQIDKKIYNVLLCHSPINIYNNEKLKNKNINLILCGHMHGGVVFNFLRPIFKNRGIISPNKVLFPKYAYGHLKVDNTDIIITSGCKVLPFKNLNKLFRPEVVIINL